MAELSHAINLFLHKNRTSFFDDDSIASGTVASLESQPILPEPANIHQDLQSTCTWMTPALQYISRKLTERELSVALIISEHEPHIIPVWPLPRKSQTIVAQIIRKAVKKFSLQPSWLTTIASAPNKRLAEIFESHRPDSYIIRRSIIQNELIFSEEGLSLLHIDRIYTFKQVLCTLSRRDLVPHTRDSYLSACVQLFRRINEVYTDPKLSPGYLARVYKEVEFQKASFEEVNRAIETNYCTASIKDFTSLEPDFSALSESHLEFETEDANENGAEVKYELGSSPVAELPDTSSNTESLSHDPRHGIISPVATSDSETTQNSCDERNSDESFDIISPLTVRHPTIPLNSRSSIAESPLDPHAPWSPRTSQPFNTRRASAVPKVSPPSSHEASDYGLSRIPTSAELIEAWNADLQPFTALAGDAATKKIESRNSEVPTSPGSPFEYVKSWVESWSTNAPGVLCENCHEVTVQPLKARRFTMV